MTVVTRTERRKARTAAAILDAAEGLFAARGYAAATIEAIAAEADVAIGSIYRHFGGKADVHLALVERALDRNERALAEAYAGPGTPVERLAAASGAYSRFHLEHPSYFRLVGLRDLEAPSGAALAATRRRVQRRLDALLDGLAAVIAEAVAAKEIRPVDPALTARLLWGAWNGVVALRARGTLDDEQLRDALGLAGELLLDGLRAGR